MATAYADSLLELLDEDLTGAGAAGEFTRIVVDVHAQAGLWACHADRLPLALRHLTLAREIAAAADDPAWRARTSGALSYLYSSAPRGGHGGNPRRALALLDDALNMAHTADPFTRGWLATWRADQHATLGALAKAQADVDLAHSALAAGDDGRLAGFFARASYGYGMDGHLNSVRGLTHTLARRDDEADRTFTHVHRTAANMRRRIATHAHQALGHVGAAQPEAACAMLARSVDLAVREHYPMGLRRARGVRSRFTPSWSRLACVRQLDDRLAALAGRPT